jgi:MFS family permease
MLKSIKNQPLVYVFISSFLVLFVGMGLFPILPLYATRFGASKTMVGVYYAVMYVANATGSMLPAWLGARLSNRAMFVSGSLVGLPALFLLGKATSLFQVVLLTSLLWFSGGLLMALVNVFTGMYASSQRRGASFSIMSLPLPFGALIGSAVVGRLVTWQGYPSMFMVLGALWICLPLIGVFLLREKQSVSPKTLSDQEPAIQTRFTSSFYLLLGLTLVSTLAVNAGRLGTSLSMQTLNFSPADIASSATVSALVTIPLTLLIGTLSDRMGRERLLVGCYLLSAAGALTLVFATQLWQFWLAASCLLVSLSASGALAFALATDLLSGPGLSRGLSWMKGMGAMASVISFASTGLFLDTLGPIALYLAAMILPVAAAYVLEAVGCKPKRFVPVPAGIRNDFFCM